VRADDACRLVFVGEDGDVYETRPDARPRRLTWGWSEGAPADRLYYVWPSYSPDGAHVACFGVRTGAVPEAGLYAVADDGIRMHEIWRMREAAPICESWSADSNYIALLLQGEDDLELEIASMSDPGRTRTLERGAPLFWSWSPVDDLLAVHSGGSSSIYNDARLSVYRVGAECELVTRLAPGEFRAPAWSPDGSRLAYVDAADGRREYLALYEIGDARGEILCPVEGQTVMLWSPDGSQIAVSQALGDSPHLLSGITLVDVATGATRTVEDADLVSFFWSPCSRKIVSMSFDERTGMRWRVLDLDRDTRREGEPFYPSRELVYFCWFFDQFATSHPLISADGTRLAFAGHMPGRAWTDEDAELAASGRSSVYVASLEDEPTGVHRVASGHFACWDARLRPAAVARAM
jgi:hypothetical protein